MLSNALVSHISQAAEAAESARAGDLSPYADVLRWLDALAAAAPPENEPVVRQVSVASSELVKHIMMDADPATDKLLDAVRAAVHSLRSGAISGVMPDAS